VPHEPPKRRSVESANQRNLRLSAFNSHFSPRRQKGTKKNPRSRPFCRAVCPQWRLFWTPATDFRFVSGCLLWHDRIQHNEAAVCRPIKIPTRGTTVLFKETPDQVRVQMYFFDFPDRSTFTGTDQPRLKGQLTYKLTAQKVLLHNRSVADWMGSERLA
jgi:hypothetical protein